MCAEKHGFPWAPTLYGVLVFTVFLPGQRENRSLWPFLILLSAIALFSLARWLCRSRAQSISDITALVFAVLLLWELCTSKLNFLNPITVPTPEDVCLALYLQRAAIVRGIGSSLSLLLIGFLLALPAGTLLGMIIGWTPRLRNSFYPVARVLSSIPPSIYSSYVVAIMPTFRSASATVLVLGLFWPTLLNIIGRVGNIDRSLLDTAAVLCLGKRDWFFKILFPYLLPGLISSLHVQLSTSFLLLTLAEMMGAASGLGYFVKLHADYANYANVVAGIIVTGAVVTLLNRLISLGEKKLLVWKT